ncbi:MAG TPA: hydroxymethylbilane synthase [Armatimonadota bacterium]|jgi:hydroxymethylbilane synthase
MPRINKLKVGTRGSALALCQTKIVVERLKELHPGLEIEIVTISTQGDRSIDVPLASIGDKGLFVKELENGLLHKEIDFAVHSLKDLPGEMPKGLCIAAVPKRADPSDVIVSNSLGLDELPKGARIGTGSVRRRAQLKDYRPDLVFCEIRGNLDTRLRKLDEGRYDAIILAYAGLFRMGWAERITEKIPHAICLPAVGQGALAVQARDGEEDLLEILHALDHTESRTAVLAERSLMQALGGGCQFPLGALAVVEDGTITLQGMLAGPDGQQILREQISGPINDPETLGRQLADVFRNKQ